MPGPPLVLQHTTPRPPDECIIPDEVVMRRLRDTAPTSMTSTSSPKAPSPAQPPPWRNGSSRPAPAPGGQVITSSDMRAKRTVTADQAWLLNLRNDPNPLPLLEDQTGVYYRQGIDHTYTYRLRYNDSSPLTVMYEDRGSGGKLWIGSNRPQSLNNTVDGITMRVCCICLGWCKGGARNCL